MHFVIKNGSVRGNGEKRVFQNNGHLAQSHKHDIQFLKSVEIIILYFNCNSV